MTPAGRAARLLDQVLSALDAAPTPRQYALLRIAKLLLERRVPAYYPPVVVLTPVRAPRIAA